MKSTANPDEKVLRHLMKTASRVSVIFAAVCLASPVAIWAGLTLYAAPVSVTNLLDIAPGNIDRIAGNGTRGFSGDGGPALSAALAGPRGIAVAADGTIYFADNLNARIRRIETDGTITTVVGNGVFGDSGDNGPGELAQIAGVLSVAVDPTESFLYFADIDNNRVRRVDLSTGIVSTFAGGGIFAFGFAGDGGPAVSASLAFPEGVAVSNAGDVYIADLLNCRVRMVDASGIIRTVAGSADCDYEGDGNAATSAEMTLPSSIDFDEGDNLYIADREHNVIRRVDRLTGIITTIAGGGTGVPGTGHATSFQLDGIITGIAIHAGQLYITNSSGYRVFKVDLATGILSIFAGTGIGGSSAGDGGPAVDATFSDIGGVAVTPGGYVLLSDADNNDIRAVAPDSPHPTPTPSFTPTPTVTPTPTPCGLINGDLTVAGAADTVVDLSCVTGVTGDVDVTGNTAAGSIDLGNLQTVGGSVDVSDNTSAGSINLGNLQTVGGDINIGANSSASSIDLGGVETVPGDISIYENSSASIVDLAGLQTVDGSISITNNAKATIIDLSGLDVVDGSVKVTGNAAVTTIDLGSLSVAGGSVDINGNAAAITIDLGNLVTVGSEEIGTVAKLKVAENNDCALVILGSLISVTGNMTLESCGTGAFAIGNATVSGDARIKLANYTSIVGLTAMGSTSITNLEGVAMITMILPTGAFSNPVSFQILQLKPSLLTPEPGNSPLGTALISPVAAYQFTFGVPTLNGNASLTFDIRLAEMDPLTRTALLQALSAGQLTLATKGDAPDSTYQSFPICASGESPLPEGCVELQKLDANGEVTASTPAILRFSNVVGHFSTWGVAIVVPDASSSIFNGLLDPYSQPNGSMPTIKRGRTFPIKFNWKSQTGVVIDSSAANPSVSIFPTPCESQVPTTSNIELEDSGSSGGLRYDADSQTWIFNWSTKGLPVGCYSIRVAAANSEFESAPSMYAIAVVNR